MLYAVGRVIDALISFIFWSTPIKFFLSSFFFFLWMTTGHAVSAKIILGSYARLSLICT